MARVDSFEEHRVALTAHCYRMLGSAAEAEDAVQETMLRAWRNLERLEQPAALRGWLYRIATNVCLDAIGERARRARPMELCPACTPDDTLTQLPSETWVEPIPDALVLPAAADPAELTALRSSVRLAFVAALQHLPPRQRAALLLSEVIDFSAAEIAESLEMSIPAVNSALQRARATLAVRDLECARMPLSAAQAELLERYVDAFERFEVQELTALLHEDATLSMPPYALWLRGPASIASWLAGRGSGCRGSRLVPTAANGSPAFGQYRPGRPGGKRPAWALIVLELSGDRIAGLSSFLDVAALFPRFGLALQLDA